jgi:predicted O-methyltransferase YrrM
LFLEIGMDEAFEAVARDYQKRADAEAELVQNLPVPEVMRRGDEFLLAVGPATAAFLNLLVREAKCRRVLEVGTSLGYSTLWLAEAVRATGGLVTTLELRASKSDFAQQQIARAGLSAQVQFCVGDALESLKALPGPFDFVLIDLWKDLYVPVFDRVYPKLSAGAIIVADNMLFPPAARPDAAAYQRRVRAAPEISSVLLPIGSGLEVSRFQSSG